MRFSTRRAAQAVALVKKIETHCKAHPDICIARDHPLLVELDAELEALMKHPCASIGLTRK